MAAINTTTQTEQNYDRFIAELTAITRKYGVAIKSGGACTWLMSEANLTSSPTRPTSAVATCTRISRKTKQKPNRFAAEASQ